MRGHRTSLQRRERRFAVRAKDDVLLPIRPQESARAHVDLAHAHAAGSAPRMHFSIQMFRDAVNP